eukprot:CAMPEP_0195531298 /NCGR_PEP_ID=MMETSP0794_2-20130614/34947_1 /TAXON_ID=515487 /ORGANISM="Stephanopyxis turris, Strain CCMP 815" /LENGTH=190 /DNA_ID=CAMNT_0040663035 /DNA_START=160 /DNA_END=729 /DNA_ORIENTATION=+
MPGQSASSRVSMRSITSGSIPSPAFCDENDTRRKSHHSPAMTVRGGAESSDNEIAKGGVSQVLASFWAMSGVVYILMKAIKRVMPIALEPFSKIEGVASLSTFQLGAYVSTCLWFAYVEGYKGFQRKFSPLVVARSLTLGSSAPLHHILLGPFYAMGLFHATKKRMIVSWSVSIGVAAIVAAVKRLPYPW